MAAFTLAHLSDPHLPPLPKARLGDLAGKRALGYLNWIRNRHKFHRRDVLDALLADVQTQAPDQIAVTGDFVNLALAAEFEPARAWLESVGSPERVAIVPGNHDAYVRITRHRFSETFEDYLRGDAPDGGEPFPFLRRRGPLALIGVSSAVPTPPLMATGRLGRSQLDALDRILTDLSAAQAFRVLLIHHPLRSDSRVKRLTDSKPLLALLERRDVDLILTGTIMSIQPYGSMDRAARFRQSACRRRPRSPTAATPPRRTICSRSRATARRGAANRRCGGSTIPCASGNSVRRG